MYELKIENHRGDLLDFSKIQNYTVSKIMGLNPVTANINTSANATTDGSKVNSARMGNRNIVIYIAINNDVEGSRIELYKYFAPKMSVKIFFKNGTRDVYIEGVVESVECDLFAKKQTMQASILCPKPYFKSVNDLVNIFSDTQGGFQFPFRIPKEGMEFSVIRKNDRKSIMNAGEIETGMIIELYSQGTVVNPVIYDVMKRTKMKLNFTMRASDKLIINTNVGEKSIELVRAGVTTNAMGYLAKDSQWFVLEAGENIFTYDADEGNSSLEITFRTPILYGGV